jgi:hypothetical protein
MLMAESDHETRTFEARLADVQAVGRPYRFLEGRAVPYGVWTRVDWLMESHQHGSLKRSTNGRAGVKLPLLLGHDPKVILGHAERWDHPDDGLHGVWKLNDSPDAQRAAKMAEAGDLVGMSIGFLDVAAPIWEYPRDLDLDGGPDQLPRVTRVESRLVEVSMTPVPAFVDAEVTQVRDARLILHTRARRPAPPEREVERWRRLAEQLRSGPATTAADPA